MKQGCGCNAQNLNTLPDMKITDAQKAYLLQLVNKATGKAYKFLSQVTEDGIGKKMSKVQGISKAEASVLIEKWKNA